MCMLVGYKHSCAPVPKKACWAFVFSACSPSMLRTRDKRREGDRAESEGPGKSGQRFLRSEVPRSVEGQSENGGDWGRTGQGWGRNEAGTLRRRAKPVVSQHLSSGAGYALADVSLRRLYILQTALQSALRWFHCHLRPIKVPLGPHQTTQSSFVDLQFGFL